MKGAPTGTTGAPDYLIPDFSIPPRRNAGAFWFLQGICLEMAHCIHRSRCAAPAELDAPDQAPYRLSAKRLRRGTDLAIVLLSLQLLLPLALLSWTLLLPANDLLGRITQVTALAAVILSLFMTGLWLTPPWWTLWVWLAGMLIVGAMLALRGPTQLFPANAVGYLRAILLATVTLYASAEAWLGFLGRQAPELQTVDLQSPLNSGVYLVVNGGNGMRVNSHHATLDPDFRGFADYRGQSHAVDIVKLNGWGGTSDGVYPRDPMAWEIYGDPVRAPCSGQVKMARDGVPDTPVPIPDRENMTGNFVLLSCGLEVEVLLAHFSPGSVAVSAGQTVQTGELLGAVGNTGNTNAPHLHVHAQRPSRTDSPFAGDPLLVTFDGRYLVRGDRILEQETSELP